MIILLNLNSNYLCASLFFQIKTLNIVFYNVICLVKTVIVTCKLFVFIKIYLKKFVDLIQIQFVKSLLLVIILIILNF